MGENLDQVTSNESVEDSVRVWQCEALLCGTALHEVFAWLAPEELARAGAACRAWRRAAAEPALWRRHLLRAGAAPAALHALKQHDESVSWRQEYVTACAGFREECTLFENRDDSIRKVSLSLDRRYIAASGHIYLAIWEYSNDEWCKRWRVDMEPLGLTSMYYHSWNKDASNLMVFGCLNVPDWEIDLLVFQVHDKGDTDEGEIKDGKILARVSNITEAFWNTCYSFITFETTHLGYDSPRPDCFVSWTNVYLYAVSKEPYCEYTKTQMLLRIYSENDHMFRTTFTNGFAVDVPNVVESQCDNVDLDYLRTIQHSEISSPHESQYLVANYGTWLGAWQLETLPIPEPNPKDYANLAKVRAACTEATYSVRLPIQPFQLAPHFSKRCLWMATCDGGATCLSLPTLRTLRVFTSPDGFHLHDCCLFFAITPTYIIVPNFGTSWPWSKMRRWHARTGASGPLIEAYELETVIPYSDNQLMVLNSGGLKIYRSRATLQPTLQDLDSPETTSHER